MREHVADGEGVAVALGRALHDAITQPHRRAHDCAAGSGVVLALPARLAAEVRRAYVEGALSSALRVQEPLA